MMMMILIMMMVISHRVRVHYPMPSEAEDHGEATNDNNEVKDRAGVQLVVHNGAAGD